MPNTPALKARGKWSPRSIAWRAALAPAPWPQFLVVCAATLIPLAILEFGHVPPRTRPHNVGDATISYPRREDTIPAWVAFLAPLGLWLASAIVGEAGLRRSANGSATAAARGVAYHSLDALGAVFVTALVTEATKLGVGWLRPYFMAACVPGGPDSPACTTATQRAARVSFPSGHTSVSAVTATFTAVYLLWAAAAGGAARRATSTPRCRDGVLGAALLAGLAQLFFAWGIGATRLTDYRHHPADVVGGFLLGGLVGGAFAARSILGRLLVEGGGEEEGGGARLASEAGAAVV